MVIVPGLCALPEGAAIDHVTDWLGLFVPVTTAVNCTWVPMMAELGETVIEVIVGPVGSVGVVVVDPPPPPPQPVIKMPHAIPAKATRFERRNPAKGLSISSAQPYDQR